MVILDVNCDQIDVSTTSLQRGVVCVMHDNRIHMSYLSLCFFFFQHEGKPYCNKPCYAALFGPGGKTNTRAVHGPLSRALANAVHRQQNALIYLSCIGSCQQLFHSDKPYVCVLMQAT